MNNSAKKEYLKEIRKRYLSAAKNEKSLILDQFCTVCCYNRKYCFKAITEFLKDLWIVTNLVCSQRLKAAIPLWLPFYKLRYKNSLSEKEKQLLIEISQRTIDRLLKRLKSKYKKFGLSTTKPGSLLKKQVPIKLNQWDESKPGFIEADTVAHCGSSVSGQFVYNLNIVDIATGWTE